MDMHAEGMVTDRQQRGELKALEGTSAHKGLHTIDIFRRDAGQINILSPLRFFNQRMKDRIQHIVLGQRILILPDATPPTAPYRRCSEEWRTSLRAH
mgnify:CR=1 FL=1